MIVAFLLPILRAFHVIHWPWIWATAGLWIGFGIKPAYWGLRAMFYKLVRDSRRPA
jgi:hypothetical protein